LIPWTLVELSIDPEIPLNRNTTAYKITVEYTHGEITVLVNDSRVARVHNDRLRSGLTGMALFGRGDAVFHDLLVEGFR
jgi:hypothetical protein